MSGKYTELGMDYQKRVLMYCSICLSNSYNEFHYEGEDDIDCINVNDGRKLFIQAKSGSPSFEEKKNIFYKWIELKPTNNCLFEIYSLKNSKYDLSKIKKEVLKDLENALERANSSNVKKAYLSCVVNGTYNKEKAEEYFDIISGHFNCHTKITEEVLDKNIFDFYKKTKIHDDKFVDSQIEKHIEYITKEYLAFIHNSIQDAATTNSPIIVDASIVDRWIDGAKQTYGINRYNRRQFEFKNNLNDYFDDSKREISQLKLLGIPDGIIADSLINEVFYKDFRDYYLNVDQNDIDSIENKAFRNYLIETVGMNLNNKEDCVELFKKVYEKKIDDPLIIAMADAMFCSSGCYIYLTSEEAKPDKQITWIKENE